MDWCLEMFEYYQEQLAGYEKDISCLKQRILKLEHELRIQKNIQKNKVHHKSLLKGFCECVERPISTTVVLCGGYKDATMFKECAICRRWIRLNTNQG